MTVEEIVRRVRERSSRLASGLPVPTAPIGSDFSLSGVVPIPEAWKPASVLVPLVNRAPGVTFANGPYVFQFQGPVVAQNGNPLIPFASSFNLQATDGPRIINTAVAGRVIAVQFIRILEPR